MAGGKVSVGGEKGSVGAEECSIGGALATTETSLEPSLESHTASPHMQLVCMHQ